MDKLNLKNCIPCKGGVPILSPKDVDDFLLRISSRWKVTHEHTRIRCDLKTNNFADSMAIAIKVGKMADEQWHHPEFIIGFGHLSIEVWTHKINGLVESDFIFASKVDEILGEFSSSLIAD